MLICQHGTLYVLIVDSLLQTFYFFSSNGPQYFPLTVPAEAVGSACAITWGELILPEFPSPTRLIIAHAIHELSVSKSHGCRFTIRGKKKGRQKSLQNRTLLKQNQKRFLMNYIHVLSCK